MDFVELHASLREEKGKELNKKLRGTGLVPAVVYKKGEDTLSLKIANKDLFKALHTEAGENVIIKLRVDGLKKKRDRTVVLKEIQKDPIRDHFLHVDFQEISLTETLKVKVPLAGKGEAIGVKEDGGVLQQVLWEGYRHFNPYMIITISYNCRPHLFQYFPDYDKPFFIH